MDRSSAGEAAVFQVPIEGGHAMRSTTSVLVTTGLLIFGWSVDAAAGQYWDHFGNSSTTIYVGTDPNDGDSQWVAYEEYPSGNCWWDYIGSGAGYTESVTVMGMGGEDWMFEAPSGGVVFCGYTLEPPKLNGHQLGFNGGDGNDYIVEEPGHTGTFSAFSRIEGDYCTNPSCSGDPAYDDLLVAYADDWTDQPQMFGGNGNDIIWASLSTSSATLSGGAGTDCIEVNSSASTSCGSGTDGWKGSGARPADCEFTVASCL